MFSLFPNIPLSTLLLFILYHLSPLSAPKRQVYPYSTLYLDPIVCFWPFDDSNEYLLFLFILPASMDINSVQSSMSTLYSSLSFFTP